MNNNTLNTWYLKKGISNIRILYKTPLSSIMMVRLSNVIKESGELFPFPITHGLARPLKHPGQPDIDIGSLITFFSTPASCTGALTFDNTIERTQEETNFILDGFSEWLTDVLDEKLKTRIFKNEVSYMLTNITGGRF